MQRNLENLSDETYDVLVIGGGIFGACIAWDASLRGMKVALVEKDDFGQFTSANSMRTIHGGLRYLQKANFDVARKMVVERRAWLRIAPHLVSPIRFVIPTFNNLLQEKWVLKWGLAVNDLLAFDRNKGLKPENKLPESMVISKSQCLAEIPGLDPGDVTGGAVWHDAQIQNSERIILGIITSAQEAGAEVANYVEVLEYLVSSQKVRGVRVRDRLLGSEFDIRSKIVVNSVGAWTDLLLSQFENYRSNPKFRPSVAFNLLIDRVDNPGAVGFPSKSYSEDARFSKKTYPQTLFIVPWRNYSIIGTKHLPCQGSVSGYVLSEEYITKFVAEINASYNGLNLGLGDIRFVHHGFLPAHFGETSRIGVKLVRDNQIFDHQEEGIDGLVTVVGTKFTTARLAAENTVNLLFRKSGLTTSPCLTKQTPISGGDFQNIETMIDQARFDAPKGLPGKSVEHLVRSYGTRYRQLFKLMNESPSLIETITENSPVVKAEILYGVRYEMAQNVADIIQRRTELWMDRSLTDSESLQIVELINMELKSGSYEDENEAIQKTPASHSFALQSQDVLHAISN